MKYKVVWSPSARAELARLSKESGRDPVLKATAGAIDAMLAIDPRAVGIMRLVSTWMLVEKPLVVVYDIIEDDQIVVISEVWLTK